MQSGQQHGEVIGFYFDAVSAHLPTLRPRMPLRGWHGYSVYHFGKFLVILEDSESTIRFGFNFDNSTPTIAASSYRVDREVLHLKQIRQWQRYLVRWPRRSTSLGVSLLPPRNKPLVEYKRKISQHADDQTRARVPPALLRGGASMSSGHGVMTLKEQFQLMRVVVP